MPEARAPASGGPPRKILHLDMDAFYAAIEQRDDPALRGRPIAVGGSSGRGVVMTASYEARRFGVRSAMPTAHALRLCPSLVLVRPRFEAYKEASRTIRALMLAWTPLVEPLSLDEAYLDVTEPLRPAGSAVDIARRLKAEILAATGLTASAGVSYCKLLAKLASDLEKPDGLTVVRPAAARGFLAALPVERFHGVGPATARRLHALGLRTGADLQAAERATLEARLGRSGGFLWAIAQGCDDRPVRPDRPRRSLSVETTFVTDLTDPTVLDTAIDGLAGELARRLAAGSFLGRSLTLKIKTHDFVVRTRSTSWPGRPPDAAALAAAGRALLRRPALPTRPVRLLGLGLTRGAPADDERQLDLLG
jgi:DNA polymerase-4